MRGPGAVARRVGEIARVVVRGCRENRLLSQSAVLTLSYLLALIPLLALILFAASVLGYREMALDWLQQYVAEVASAGRTEIVETVIVQVKQANVAALGVVGLMFLVYAAYDMLATVERSFNEIWGVPPTRSIPKRLAIYLGAAMVFPVLIFVSSLLNATVRSLEVVERAREVSTLSGVVGATLEIGPVLAIVVGFTLIYKYVPHTSVRLRSAVLAGCIAGLTFRLVEWAFIRFQIGVTNSNIFYGTLAALPIFILWVRTGWVIILVGCEIAHAVQTEPTGRRLSGSDAPG